MEYLNELGQDLGGEGVLLGDDLEDGSAVFYDRFARGDMPHTVVMVGQNDEESLFTKLMLMRESARGFPVYVVDTHGRYGGVTRALGGDVHELAAGGSPGMNPFAVVCRKGDEMDAARRIWGLSALIEVMVGEGSDLRSVIDRCLTRFYTREARAVGDGGVLGQGGFRDFLAYLGSDQGLEVMGERLSDALSGFAGGPGAALMGPGAGLDGDAGVVCFDLGGVEPRLLSFAACLCVDVVWALAVRDPQPRMLIVDECCSVLGASGGGRVLTDVVKRARKQRLGVVSVTRGVEELLGPGAWLEWLGGHFGWSLLQNCLVRVVLGPAGADVGGVVNSLGLSGSDGEFLAGALLGQGLVIFQSAGYSRRIGFSPGELEAELLAA